MSFTASVKEILRVKWTAVNTKKKGPILVLKCSMSDGTTSWKNMACELNSFEEVQSVAERMNAAGIDFEFEDDQGGNETICVSGQPKYEYGWIDLDRGHKIEPYDPNSYL